MSTAEAFVHTPVPPMAQRKLGEIAVNLPGATAVFRRHKLDFCCGGSISLSAAAARKGIALERLLDELGGLDGGAAAEAPDSPAELIDHILSRYHEVHRRELPELIRLARRVEAVHRSHEQAPAGLADSLEETQRELEQHMEKEEAILFPLMRQGGTPMIVHPVTRMRMEHDDHGERLRAIEELSHGGVLPQGACPTWAALYSGLRKFTDDLTQHIHLENNLLFPRFEP